MLQIFAAFTFLVLAAGALALIAATLAGESRAILGALRGTSQWAPVRQDGRSRVRFVSMPAPVAGSRKQRRAFA